MKHIAATGNSNTGVVQKDPTRFALGLAASIAALLVYLSSAGFHVFYGGMNTDEGFYAIATRAVANGEVPYRDFGFTQPPLVLYVNALPLRAFGFGLFALRAINGLWTGLAMLVAALWIARRTRPSWGIALVLVFALSAPWMYFSHLGKTYGFTSLVILLATWAFLALPRGGIRNSVLGVLLVVGLGTRLPCVPCVIILWLLALWPGGRPTLSELGGALGSVILASTVFILPFWLMAPEQMKFWVVDFHRASVPVRDWQMHWQDIVTLAPAVWALVIVAILIAVLRRRLVTRETGALLASAVALIANLFSRGAYEEYGVPFLLPLAVAAAPIVFDQLKTQAAMVSVVFFVVLLTANLVTAPIVTARMVPDRVGTPSQWLTPRSLPYNSALPRQIASAVRIIETTLAPNAPFIGSNLILAAETGRSVPRELRMGAFTVTDEMPAGRAARLHLATRNQLDFWYRSPEVTTLSFFQRMDLDYNWSMPSFASATLTTQADTLNLFRRNFQIAYNEGEFLILVRRQF